MSSVFTVTLVNKKQNLGYEKTVKIIKITRQADDRPIKSIIIRQLGLQHNGCSIYEENLHTYSALHFI